MKEKMAAAGSDSVGQYSNPGLLVDHSPPHIVVETVS